MILHHIGIVVDNLAEATPLFEVWMGARRIGDVVEDETQGARIQLFLMGDHTLLEVVEALPGEETPLHRNGEFHLCFTVPDLDEEMARLHELGAVVTHPTVHSPLFDQRRLGFVATHSGQLLELLEEQRVTVQ
jgi:catechol 2,3-dioxygenase-like lactoylglutathione lyase family enzyme